MEVAATLSIFRFEENFIFSLICKTKQPHAHYDRKVKQPHASYIYAPFSVGAQKKIETTLQKQLHQDMSVVVKLLQSRFSDLAEVPKSSSSTEARVTLNHLGQRLFNHLPPVLQEALRSLPPQLPILIQSNDSSLPWELLHDGHQFLALKHPIGRLLWSGQLRQFDQEFLRASTSDNRSFLFICNPTGDLESADEEHEQLWDLFEPEFASGVKPYFLARNRATKRNVLQHLAASHDLIHYSGHAKPGALLLADGQLTSEEIRQASRGRPFVFLNGCWSVKEGSNKLAEVNAPNASLASAFMSAGAIGFLGTRWPIFDQTSRYFAESFYTHVRQGMSVGEALRQTRLQMSQTAPSDPIWASFVLYGDPRVHLTTVESEETRLVTVLVAQLDGFERSHFEAGVERLEKVKGLLRQISKRYRGQVETPFSDIIKVYFGRTFAYGDDAEYACRAALDMIRALTPKEERGLGLRIGISSGQIMNFGHETTGIVESHARKLAISAKPGQIWVDKATCNLARSRFTFSSSPVDIIRATPNDQSVEAYRMVGSRRAHIRQVALFGRQKERAQLRQWWHEVATTGQGRLVGIIGAAGVGKTRLVAAFRDEIIGNYECISAVCHSYNHQQSYSLLAQVIKAKASINPEDNDAIQRQKLTELVDSLRRYRGHTRRSGRSGRSSSSSPLHEGVALLSGVIGLPFASPELDNLDPKLRQNKLERLIVALLSTKPMVLLLENLQWADEASLTVLTKVVNAIGRMPLLLLASYRPDWSHGWGNTMHYRQLPVEELPDKTRRELLAHLLGLTETPEKLAQMILSKTGGHPLFIEEYVWLLQENGSLMRKGHDWTISPAKVVVPSSIERVIQARLDRLPIKARQLIQTAAVIGDQFDYELLHTVIEKDNRVMGDYAELPRLVMRSLIYEAGGWPDSFYSFSHGLVHDIVYKLLPEQFRRTVHRYVAQALGELYDEEEEISQTDVATHSVYRLAHHYYHSHDRINAIRYALQAGKRHASQWANQTALKSYGRALEKIESLMASPPAGESIRPESVTPAQMLKWQVEALEGQADVQKTIGQAEDAIKGYAQALELVATDASITKQADLYRKLATAHHDKGQFDAAQDALNKGLSILDGQLCLEAGRIHIYTGLIHFRRGQLLAGLASCEEAIVIIEKTENTRDLAQAYNLQCILYYNLGKHQKAIEAHKQSSALYKQAEDLSGQERASFNLACVLDAQGRWQEALEVFQKCSLLSQQTGDLRRQAAALSSQGEIYRRQGELDQAISAYSQARQIVEELGSREFVGVVLMNLGASYLCKGELAEAKTYLSESLALFERLEANLYLPEAFCWLAELSLYEQQLEKAKALAEKAVKWSIQHQAQEGPARRRLGQAYRALGQLADANIQLEQSLELLEKQNNPVEIGLTLIELAQLRQAQAFADQDNREAMAFISRAIAIFSKLGAALELKRAQEIRSLLEQ